MSFTGGLFSKLGFGEAPTTSALPQFASPPSRGFSDLDLAELSPKPDDALLAGRDSDDTQTGDTSSVMRNRRGSTRTRDKRNNDSVRASVSFQEPPRSPGRTGSAGQSHADKMVYHESERSDKPPPVWHASLPSESLGSSHSRKTSGQVPFFDSMFAGRPTHSRSSTPVDQTFKVLERREHQMQRELQQLLDAQDYALEKHLASTAPDDDATPRPRSPTSKTPNGHVIPVRQPKKRHLSKREARLGIARCMSQLSDLKNEEEAYIATALAQRKAALSKLRNLSTKRNSILAEMHALESDQDQPFKNQTEKMEQQHRTVCEDIIKLEEKLRELKQTKAKLEKRITAAKSSHDSELSGYKGALGECDKRISDIMAYPEVTALEMEGLASQQPDVKALIAQHISGFEFLSLRPERRTLPMAKDWWEGEVQVLEHRKVAVDKERTALDEGTQLWQDMLGRLEEHDRHLKLTFEVMSEYASAKQKTADSDDEMGEILKKQYAMCKDITHELEELCNYTETQGWKLLVTALGAEIHYFRGLKQQLGETLHFVGWADGVVTPRPSTPSHTNDDNGDNLLGGEGHSATNPEGSGSDLDDDLTRSIIRPWDSVAELHPYSDDLLLSVINLTRPRGASEGDNENEVPAGLLSEVPRHGNESEDDEHNEVPPEFLSMHSPQPKMKDKWEGKMIASENGLRQGNRRDEDQGQEEEEREREGIHPLTTRESSSGSSDGGPNEVLPDSLGTESRTF
ncbi:hypothetical protein GGR50DRAFT_696748 [Xylaria sp. CBS 124048]|nr:hypothetical protein GGR50DRAFT_696748 [Xylaria sp. CBS 124048]